MVSVVTEEEIWTQTLPKDSSYADAGKILAAIHKPKKEFLEKNQTCQHLNSGSVRE